MDFLNRNYDQLDRDEQIKGRYICSILQANSWERSKRKDAHMKKFRKMAEKTQFWAGAIKHRVLKDGMTINELDEAEKALSETM